MRYITSAILFTLIISFSAILGFAQETEETVVDEVIAQVNEDVITLSRIRREMKFAVDSLVEQGKTKEEAKKTVESQEGQLIANIINEELMSQKAKEVGLDKTVEAEINSRFTKMRLENNYKSLDDLFKAMRSQGVDPDSLRLVWRPQIMRDLVWRELVDREVYFGIKDKELKEYYSKNATKFKKEATVTISEIFLNFAGRDAAELKKKADDIVRRARAGEDFGKLAVENSDRPNVAETKGKAGVFNVTQIDKIFAEPLKGVKVGGVTEPIIMQQGIEIIKVDERTAASDESTFDENSVRQAMLQERIPTARRDFMNKLKADAYIKIRESYRPIVNPYLNPAEKDAKTTASK